MAQPLPYLCLRKLEGTTNGSSSSISWCIPMCISQLQLPQESLLQPLHMRNLPHLSFPLPSPEIFAGVLLGLAAAQFLIIMPHSPDPLPAEHRPEIRTDRETHILFFCRLEVTSVDEAPMELKAVDGGTFPSDSFFRFGIQVVAIRQKLLQ